MYHAKKNKLDGLTKGSNAGFQAEKKYMFIVLFCKEHHDGNVKNNLEEKKNGSKPI